MVRDTYRQVVLPLVVTDEPFVEGNELCCRLSGLPKISEERGRQVDHVPGPFRSVAKVLHHVAGHLAGGPGAGVEDDPPQPLRVYLLHNVRPVHHRDLFPLGEKLGFERAVPILGSADENCSFFSRHIVLPLVPSLERVVLVSTQPL